MESELSNFSLNLDFGNFDNETPNKRVKKMSEEELDESGSVKTRKVSIQAGQHSLHYVNVPGKNYGRFDRSRFARTESPESRFGRSMKSFRPDFCGRLF